MNMVFEQLPKAIRWSGILGIIFLINSILLFIFTALISIKAIGLGIVMLIPLAICVVLYIFCRNYKRACQEALNTQSDDDLELAMRKQSALIKLFGIFSLIMLIFILISFVTSIGAGAQFAQMMR